MLLIGINMLFLPVEEGLEVLYWLTGAVVVEVVSGVISFQGFPREKCI